MNIKRITKFCALLTVVGLTGCATQKAWVYTPATHSNNQRLSHKTAVVVPFIDKRENKNRNMSLMYMVPLMPWGWMNLEVPEGLAMHMNSGLWTNYRPTEDYAKALASELESANIFSESYFDFKKGDSDYIIKGEIITTKYGARMISYGLSVYGPLLWFFGLPATTTSNDLSIALSCVSSSTGEVLFSKEYTALTSKQISSIYNLKNDFNYSELLKNVCSEFIDDLRNNSAALSGAINGDDSAYFSYTLDR